MRWQQRPMLCAATPAAPSVLTIAPTQTSNCWPWMHLESMRRGEQPSTRIAALLEEASVPAALLEWRARRRRSGRRRT
jgi:hypothetical protein